MSGEVCPMQFGDLVQYSDLSACCNLCVANGHRTGNTSARTSVETGAIEDFAHAEGSIGMQTGRAVEHLGETIRNVSHTVRFESSSASSSHIVSYEFECLNG
jgi:hypothetical protein